MKVFRVCLTREVTESVFVDVVAKDSHRAVAAAKDKAGVFGQFLNGWSIDEGNFSRPYSTLVTELHDTDEADIDPTIVRLELSENIDGNG